MAQAFANDGSFMVRDSHYIKFDQSLVSLNLVVSGADAENDGGTGRGSRPLERSGS